MNLFFPFHFYLIYNQRISLFQTFPELRMKELFVVQTLHESLHLDTENVMNPLMKNMMTRDEINSMFSSPFHMKGKIE